MIDIYLLIPLSFAMGFVNAITGGGGVFGVPAMLAMGIPAINALALNRFSDIGYIIGCIRNYTKIKDFDPKLAMQCIPLLLIGAAAGASFIVSITEELRDQIILVAVSIGVIFLLYPVKPKENDSRPYIIPGMIAILLLGFWDGAFAMAGGTFGVLIIVFLFKRSYLGAKSITTAAAIPETLLSVTILWLSSTLTLLPIAIMTISAIGGSYIGSKLAIKKGNKFLRYSMAGMALIMAAKVLLIDVIGVL